MAIIKWNRACMKGITDPTTGDIVVLYPGVNQIPDKQWKALRAHVQVQIGNELEEVQTPAVGDDGKPGKGTANASDLTGVEAKAAAALVKETTNLPLLQQWLLDESRQDVRVALMNRIKLLEERPAAKKGE